MTDIRVVLADDHPVVRDGIRNQLESEKDIAVVGEADDGVQALELAEDLSPDVLLLDMEMPGLQGVEVARRLQAAGSPVRVVALSAYTDKHYIQGLLSSGAAGYLTKEEAAEGIVEAVRGVARGEEGWLSREVAAQMAAWTREESSIETELTDRELEVLRLVADGKTNQQTARALGISEKTVEKHLQTMYEKLGVASRTEAAVKAIQEGFLQ